MDRDRFPMTPSREPNPLRPYYIPPSIGTSASASASQTPHVAKVSPPRSGASIGSSARDLFEIDIDIKSTTSEAWQHTRSLFDTLAWRYTSVLLAQPFDVSKTILQVALPPSSATAATPQKKRSRASSRQGGSVRGRGKDQHYDDESDDSYDSDRSDDIPDYFTSTAPRSRSPRKRRRTPPSQNASPSPTPRPRNRREQDDVNDYKIINKKPASIMNAISALYNTSGAVGLWRASNTTFLYSTLLRTTDSFVRSLLLAILGLPDLPGPDHGGLAPGLSSRGAGFSGIDLSDSPNAIGSLIVVGLASCITGLLLAPLDLVRTRLIVTPVSHPPRGLLSNLKCLPSLVASSDLWLPTALFHSIPNIFSAASPLFLRRQMRLAPETTPGLWSLAAFTTSLSELFIRLPLETVVRRAQVNAIKKAQSDVPLVIDPAPYTGVWATVYGIMYLEGETTTTAANGMLRTRRGQGAAGLVRGWRVGFWGLAGVWGAGALGPGDVKSGGQF
ncbi:Mitochondrial fusion and transport protein UGO1 [Fulvia fulva]|uniref:Mitochondrial fusion and transport protein UGO1 n=1 Tax=Passalora fulva TaxID=5499 RepID=A0A9Q8UQC7_PASFU|nr:Mitochondrial fusion and transport protein UGO1 [Fulvia fulva]KAK4621440.1 Mitochondrial fusion and transport protein UGO1 [Fulvia fulva]KAK4623355.1 Mitochondrial fusion and transport protein UGO1 [Fulvia fulva]UJO18729.1 Mitochondrial fusion and transport protein UGO1 [Fulvia fulva]WPV16616.1 Mitochondrial fusion and transport protein UGO1 [Fulvia fulva]WPV30673.1 Mitochondrial fusion and transport protein UGO1 [Fulvia fulva]